MSESTPTQLQRELQRRRLDIKLALEQVEQLANRGLGREELLQGELDSLQARQNAKQLACEASLAALGTAVTQLRDEVVRLKAGRFTEEEFQNLCHQFDENDRERFCNGCDAYQRKLFGTCRTDEIIASAERCAAAVSPQNDAVEDWTPQSRSPRPWADYTEVPDMCWLRSKAAGGLAQVCYLAVKWTLEGVSGPFGLTPYAKLLEDYEWATSPSSSIWSPCGTYQPKKDQS